MSLHHRKSGHVSRGGTILESLIYVGVIGFVLTSATMFAVEMLRGQAKANALAETVRNARFALSRVEIEIREAADINIGASTFGAHPGVLSVATSVPSTDPTVIAVSGGALTMQQGAGPVLPLTNPKVDVLEFVVENVGTPNKTKAIRIRLKMRAKNPSVLVEQVAETTVESTVRVHAKDGFSN